MPNNNQMPHCGNQINGDFSTPYIKQEQFSYQNWNENWILNASTIGIGKHLWCSNWPHTHTQKTIQTEKENQIQNHWQPHIFMSSSSVWFLFSDRQTFINLLKSSIDGQSIKYYIKFKHKQHKCMVLTLNLREKSTQTHIHTKIQPKPTWTNRIKNKIHYNSINHTNKYFYLLLQIDLNEFYI